MPDIVQQGGGAYPGVPGFESISYTALHGKTPGRVIATTRFPVDGVPAFGNVLLTDAVNDFVIRDCKLQRVETSIGDDGRLWTLTFLDRAWRWKYGSLSGHFNRRDDRGNLLPRTVKSPRELIEFCLKEMGETRWDVYAPDGLTEAQAGATDNPAPGTRTPDTATNPEFLWDNHVPVDALLEVCDKFGLRFMRCPVRDVVVIRRPGDGAALPYTDRFIDVSDGLEAYATPSGIGVAGGDALFQMKLKLVPVGKEWNGLWLPVDLLSYRPDKDPQAGKWAVKFSGDPAGNPFTLNLTINGVAFPPTTHSSVGSAAAQVVGHVTGTPAFDNVVEAEASGDTATISGVQVGDVVSIIVSFTSANPAAGAGVIVTTTQVPRKSCWDEERPGVWFGVRAVPGRLSYEQARDLAVQTVGRCYQLTSDDVSNGWGPVDKPKKIFVPLYGEIDHRDQLDLQAEMVEQVKPEAPDPTRQVMVGLAVQVADQVDFYAGTARGRSPAVYGSVSKYCQGRWYHMDAAENTPAGSQVSLPFSIDPAKQLVIFDQPVYKAFAYGGPRETYATFPNLVLETAVKLRENKTYGRLRYRRWIEFGRPAAGSENRDRAVEVDLSKYGIKGVKPFVRKLPRRRENIGTDDSPSRYVEWYPHPEAVYACIGRYAYDADRDRWRLVAAEPDPEDVSAKVGDFYLLGHLLEHTLEDAQTARYRGLELVPLDGAVMQVSWSIGPGGILTTASRNQEHGINIPAYPIRRRQENLEANAERSRLQATYYANKRGELDRLAAAGLTPAGQNK